MTAATAATLAASVIGAAGSIGGAAISSNAAKGAGAGGVGNVDYVPLPRYAQVLNRQTARATALNMDKMPPSFMDWVKSGGTAQFPWTPAGLSPVDQYKLGLVDKYGEDVPGLAPAGMTPEQQIFLGQWMAQHGQGGPLSRVGRIANRLDRIQSKPLTPKRENRIDRLEDRLARRIAGLDPGA